MYKGILSTILLLGLLLAVVAPMGTQAQQKTIRVAVLDFDLPRNREISQYGANINQRITDKIENGLLSLGSYKMVERTKMKYLEQEFALIRNGVIDPETAAKLRRVSGVDAIIYGSISEFAVTGQRTDGNYTLNDLRATLRVQVKMTNTTSGDLLIADEFIGQAPQGQAAPPKNANSANQTKEALDAGSAIWGAIKNKRLPPTSSTSRVTRPDRQAEQEWCEQLTSEAVSTLVAGVVARIQKSKKEDVQQTRQIDDAISGTVLRATGNMVYITGLPRDVLQIGDKLLVKRTTTERDPGTNKMITFDEPVGEVEVLELQATVVRGRFSSTTDAKPQRGDKVTNQ